MREVGTAMHVSKYSCVLETIDEGGDDTRVLETIDEEENNSTENDALIRDCYSVETSCWNSCWDSCIKCLDTDWFIVF